MIGFYRRSSKTFESETQQDFLSSSLWSTNDLRAAGIGPGDSVIVACSEPRSTLQAFIAAVGVGAIPTIVSVRPAFDSQAALAERFAQTAEAVGGQVTVLHEPDKEMPTARGVRTLALNPQPTSRHLELHCPRPDDPAYIQMTSGSTSAARAVLLTHRDAVVNTGLLVERGELGRSDCLFSWLPLYHDMGLVAFALLPLLHGIDCHFMTPFDFLSDPLSWPRSVDQLGATMVSSPNFGYERVLEKLEHEQLEQLDLSRWRRAYCGAEPVDPDMIRRFTAAMSAHRLPAEALKPSYGLAEATLVVTVPRQGARARAFRLSSPLTAERFEGTVVDVLDTPSPDHDVVEIPSVGPPCQDVDVWIEGPDGHRIDEDLVPGEVVVWGESVAAGYLRPDGSVDPFTSTTALHTGDLGFLHEGELYVIERLKNIVIRHGVNYSTVQAERTLAELTGLPVSRVLVLDSDLTPGRGRVTAVVELPRRTDPAALVDAVRGGADRFELPLEQLLVVKWGSMPTTTSGKKQHNEVRRRLRDDELKLVERVDLLPDSTGGRGSGDEAVIDLDAVDARHTVLALVERLATDRGTRHLVAEPASLAYDLGFDSLCLYELAVGIEDATDLRLAEADLPRLETVGDVLALVSDRRADPVAGPGITEQLMAAQTDLPQLLNVVEAQQGRQVRIEGRWVSDFASCNYLGLDLHPRVIASIEPMVREWGVHPSWTRAVASPGPYRDLEQRLAELVGVPDTVVFPTVTLLHLGVIPKLVEHGGTLLVDREAHHSIQEAAELARARGAQLVQIDRDDRDGLEAALQAASAPRFVLVDGVYSMAGSPVDLDVMIELARRHDAQIYVDDAHGFGVLGEGPTPERPYGRRGNGIVAHLGLDHERVIYVAGLSKAFSSMAAFVSARTPEERARYELSSTLVFSGPIPTASLASALSGLEVNRTEGDLLRDRLHHLTTRLVTGARSLGFEVDNGAAFPIVNVIVGPVEAARRACELLWEHGILITPAVFPAVPLHRSGLRFTLTATNTDAELDQALRALTEVRTLLGPADVARSRSQLV